MKNLTVYSNHFAVGLSALCIVHCLATPILLVMVPSLSVLGLEGEAFHKLLLFVIVPTSLASLYLGCRQHDTYNIFAIGGLGLTLLISALLVEGLPNAETLEKLVTVAGGLVLSVAHVMNYRRCRNTGECCQ